MAREAGRQAPALDGQAPPAVERPTERRPTLLEQLRSNPRAFSFVQAVRLLRQAHGGADTARAERFLRERLRVRSLLSLGFPATDLTELEDLPPREGESGPDQDRFRLTATFLGLYGPSSPLPTFYTEELLDEQSDDRSVSRDFLDVVGDGFFTLFFLAWTRHRLSLKAWEERDAATMERLFSLVGLGDPEVRNVFSTPGLMLRSAGLLTQFPRSAVGLRGLMADRAGAPVTVVQCVSRNAYSRGSTLHFGSGHGPARDLGLAGQRGARRYGQVPPGGRPAGRRNLPQDYPPGGVAHVNCAAGAFLLHRASGVRRSFAFGSG